MADRIKLAVEQMRSHVLPGARAKAAFEAQLKLADSQWFARETVEQNQLAKLKRLARFVSRQTRYGRELNAAALERATTLAEALSLLPILDRNRLRDDRAGLEPAQLPPGHTLKSELSSSGSTGMVVRIAATNVWLRLQRVLGLRAQFWAGREFHRTVGVIRRLDPGNAAYPAGRLLQRWAPRADVPFRTGRAFLLNAYTPLDQQWEWLNRVRPFYLMTVPSILRSFAKREDAASLGLAGISTLGEVVDSELRTLVQSRFNLPINDVYSSEEAGTIAIQCPDEPVYHAQGEGLIVEVLNGSGAPCQAGEIGRVVVTPLHNYATPLLRYEMNDFAEAGDACACGRGLPVIRRIMGRRRNILVTPDGREFWPSLMPRAMQNIVSMREYQFRQTARDTIEVWVAVDNPATAEQEERLRKVLAEGLLGTKGMIAPFEFRFRYLPEFPRNPNGKHEEFVSLLDAATSPPPAEMRAGA
jgi:phenylacetate-CoA ligase